MMRKTGMLAFLALLLPLTSTGLADRAERRDEGFRLFADFDAALQEARDRNIPLFVALHKDH